MHAHHSKYPARLLRVTAAAAALVPTLLHAQGRRPLTFLDGQLMRQAGSEALSTDGKWMLYTVSVPDWGQARRQSDVYLVSTERGLASTRQLTFTRERSETSPRWSRDGSFFVFLSDRDAPAAAGQGSTGTGGGGSRNQLFLMRPDGGEARRITDAREGVASFAFGRDGQWLVFSSGRTNEQQLHAIAVSDLKGSTDLPKTTQWTRLATGIGSWKFAPDGRTIYFTTPDTVDRDERLRMEKRFDVRIRNPETPLSSLCAFDVASKQTRRLTHDSTYGVGGFAISDDGKWIGFQGLSAKRYERGITEQNANADLWLLKTASGRTERLTTNVDIGESQPSFSPDSKWIAFSAPDDFRYMWNNKVYLRRVDQPGAQWRKLGGGFDGDVSVGFWSKDGRTIYFNEGIRATSQLLALDVESNTVRQLTSEKAALSVDEDENSGRLLVSYSDPSTPPVTFTVASMGDVANRARWTQLTDPNPWVRDSITLGEEEEITWQSVDGRMVGGILIKPVGYRAGQRYPLIVAIHGGPASADLLRFNGGYGAQVYAGAGYAVLLPNYRNSTNYGQRHKIESQGDYFTKGYQDIMSGVDYLIAQGIADGSRMGALGWSAGGHWSNWILTHTDRFKAISSGAGTSNWISMYAQSDVQRVRQWYMGDELPYDDYDRWWAQSPMKYIRNARTPTMIHVVDGDPRVPRPQSEELHMALKKLGVPTELFVYPGQSHGIPDARNRLVKSVAEMAWMDYWVRGSGRKFAWRDVLKTLPDSGTGRATMAGEARP